MEEITLHSRKLLSESMGVSVVGLGIIVLLCIGLLLSLYYLLKIVNEKAAIVEWKPTVTPFKEINGYSFDCVFAMPIYTSDEILTEYQQRYSHLKIIQALNFAGLETRMFYSVQQDEVFIKIRCPLDKLKDYANKIDFIVPLDPFAILRKLKNGMKDENGDWEWVPIDLMEAQESDGNISRFPKLYAPAEHIHAPYSTTAELQDLYQNEEKVVEFRQVDRLRLIMHMIQAPVREGGCNLNIKKLQAKEAILAFFPLHNYEQLRQMQIQWFSFLSMPMRQPFEDIRNYFGEKIALYFLFTGKFTNYLMYAAIPGFLTWLNSIIQDDYDCYLLGPYAIFIVVWAVVFLERWKREEARRSMTWGMENFEETESVRPSFKGEIRQSLVTGKDEIYFPPKLRYPKFFASQMYILAFILVLLGIVTAMLCIEYVTSGGGTNSIDPHVSKVHFGTVIVFTLLSILAVLVGNTFTRIAISFTEKENHRTDTNFQDSLIVKTFVFNFINSYTVLVYIAFFARAWNLKCNVRNNECMQALNYALGTIFMVRVVVGNVLEVLIPALTSKSEEDANQVTESEKEILTSNIEASLESMGGTGWNMEKILEMTAIEEQYHMTEYDTLIDMTCDMQEIVIQFGYVVLFCVSFPLIPILAFVSNYVEIRVDAWKIGSQSRRPIPKGAEDIGKWQDMMNILVVLSIIFNGAIMFFTSDYINSLYGETIQLKWKILIFALTEHIALVIKFMIEVMINDVPMEVRFQIERQNLIADKLIKNIRDEASDIDDYKKKIAAGGEDDEESSTSECVGHTNVSLTIFPTDNAYEMKTMKKKK